MSVYRTKDFARFARKDRLSARALLAAAADVAQGNFDADLGGGKSGGFRTILFFKAGRHTFFVYGFAKSERANVSEKELKALKKLASELLNY